MQAQNVRQNMTPPLSFQDEKAKKPTKKPQPRLQAYAEADVVVPLS